MKLFDLHCDTMYECYETGAALRENSLAIDRSKTAGLAAYGQFFALFCGSKPPEGNTRKQALWDLPPELRLDALLLEAKKQLALNRDWLTLCRDAEELEQAWDSGKAAAFLSVEGAELFADLDAAEHAIENGVRLVTLSWNFDSPYACGAAADNDKGLTAQGRALVSFLIARGVILDVSHLSEAGFWELAVLTEAPLAATHSNSRACCDHLRNLTDLQACELIRRGGVIGLNLYSPFLRDDGKQATTDDVLRHADHFLSLGAENCLCIGADFDGCDTLPEGIHTLRDMERLYNAMLGHGYLQSTVDGIFFNNAVRFLQRML